MRDEPFFLARDRTLFPDRLRVEDGSSSTEVFQVMATGNQTGFTGFVLQEPSPAN